MLLRLIGAFASLGLLLAACAIEGGAPTATPITIAPTFGPAPTDAAVAAANAARDDTWAIGLLDQPRDLYPYARDAPSQRLAAPLIELMFPAPELMSEVSSVTFAAVASPEGWMTRSKHQMRREP